MAKLSGGNRTLKTGSRRYSKRETEYYNQMDSGNYSAGYFSKKGGGYYVVEKKSNDT